MAPGSGGFAKATVVARKAPVSSHLGDSATVYADGTMEGFVGGACARDIVRRQALHALHTNTPVLVQIRPDAERVELAGDGSSIVIPMTCSSEGAVDVFIEPHLPRRRLLIAGFTPVADALARLADAADYATTRFVETAELTGTPAPASGDVRDLSALAEVCRSLGPEAARTAGVVASQGHYDEEALEPMLHASLPYVGLLASRKRAAAIRSTLLARSISAAQFERVHNPAGLDLGAKDPLGVAVSILAEVVSFERRTAPGEAAVPSLSESAIDPVCTMEVEIATARHSINHAGQTFYFCGAGCLESFRADPHAARGAAPAR